MFLFLLVALLIKEVLLYLDPLKYFYFFKLQLLWKGGSRKLGFLCTLMQVSHSIFLFSLLSKGFRYN